MFPFKSSKSSNSEYFWHVILFLSYPLVYLVSIITLKYIWISDFSLSDREIIILWLATFRLTRLFVYDQITNFIREPLKSYKNWLWKSLSELLNCPWCTSVWSALIIYYIYKIDTMFLWLIYILALAWIVWFLQLIYKLLARYSDIIKQ